MLENIPQNRLSTYLILIGFLPLACVAINFFSKQSGIQEIEGAMEYTQQKAFSREKKQAINMSVRNFYRDADHFYIDKNLETLTFLEPEIESLQKMGKDNLFPEDDQIKKRTEFLTGPGNNTMVFSEGIVEILIRYFRKRPRRLCTLLRSILPIFKPFLAASKGWKSDPTPPFPTARS